MADDKLKQAMAEIKVVLHKYNIAGAVTLVSPTHSEFLYHLTPSWSVCYFKTPNQLHFRAKETDFKSAEQHKFCVESTVHMILQIRDVAAQTFTQMQQVEDMLKQHFEIEHTSYADFEPHEEH